MTAKPPFVIHVSEMADFPDAVYIGRENGRKRLKRSKWANPFVIGKEPPHWFAHRDLLDVPMTRNGVMFGFAMWIWMQPDLLESLSELRGKPLACWCHRSDEPMVSRGEGDNRCHGDLIVRYLERFTDDELAEKAMEARNG